MKKILYIASIMLLGAVACNKEANELIEKQPVKENSGLVAVTMGLRVPVELTAMTRAGERDYRDHLPKIDALRVAVFGTSSYPQAYAYAEPVLKTTDTEGNTVYVDTNNYASTNDVNPSDNQDIYYFKVLLPVYEGHAVVHIVANGDESIPFVDQTEFSIMSKMQTTDNVGGYWARVEMPEGILTQLDANGIMMTDDDGNFIPSDETAALFEDLVLVRNFAEVTLNIKTGAGISDVTWALVNDPVTGSIAPMIGTAFVANYKDFIFDTKTAKMVRCEMETDEETGKLKPKRDSQGNLVEIYETYNGYMLSNSLNTLPATEGALNWTAPSVSHFSYERVDPNKTNPTYIMMKGKWGDDEDFSYYRVDLMDENVGGYFPLYRNYVYQIDINLVGNRGSSTYTEAARRNSGGNVSMSAETKTLTDVSDGFSRMYVQYVEKTYTFGGEKSFWVYYIPNVSNMTVDNSSIEVSVKDMGTALANGNLSVTTATGASVGLLDVDEVKIVTFTLNDQSESTDLSSVIEVKATNGGSGVNKSTLYRDVTVKMMRKMQMKLSLSPRLVALGTDKETTLHIALADTLQPSMFPLEFYIEDTNRTLNPTGKNLADSSIAVPVKLGESLYDNTNTNSYFFVRTVNWEEYQPMRTRWIAADKAGLSTDGIIDFTTKLKTIKEDGTTTIYVDNEYFNMGSVDLETGTFSVSAVVDEVSYKAGTIAVTVAADNGVSWVATVDNGAGLTRAAGTSTIEGSGTETITVNYDANTTAEPITYKITVTADEGLETSTTFVQRRAPASPYTFNSGNFSNSTANANDGYITVSYGSGISQQSSYLYASSRDNRTITITPKNGVTITEIVISYSGQNSPEKDTSPSFSPSGTVTPGGATQTWSGSTSNAVTYTCGTRYAEITNIRVTYN